MSLREMSLRELRRSMHAYATGFDAGRLSPHDAARVVEDATAIENMAASVKALAAARLAETEVWKRDGDRTAAHHLARTTGVSVGRAQETLLTAQRLEDLPATTAAALSGTLSAAQIALIADAAGADPAGEQRLLERSRTVSLAELRDECARVKAGACDLEARRRRIHERRCLRTWCDGEGGANLHLRDNPEVVAEIMTTLEPIRNELFNAARSEGRREPLEAYAADAMLELVRRVDAAGGAKPGRCARAKVLVRVDLDTLLRGALANGETCELAGYGPVAVSAVRDLIDSGIRSSPRSRPRARPSSAWRTWVAGPAPGSRAPSSGSIRPAPSKAPTAWRSSRTTIARIGPRPRSRSSSCSIVSVPITTISRPRRAGRWSRAAANAPSFRPTIRSILERTQPAGRGVNCALHGRNGRSGRQKISAAGSCCDGSADELCCPDRDAGARDQQADQRKKHGAGLVREVAPHEADFAVQVAPDEAHLVVELSAQPADLPVERAA